MILDKRRPGKLIPIFLSIAFAFLFFQACNKNAENITPKKAESDTTISFETDSLSLSENLSEDEFGIFLQFEDTTGIPFTDLLLPNGDSVVNYLSKGFLNQYPLSLRQKNSPHSLRGSGYQSKDDQITAFNTLVAQITGKAQYLKSLRGKSLFPDEGKNKPGQQKIGYAVGGVKKYTVKEKYFRKELAGKSYKYRSYTPGCVDSIYALDGTGFMSVIFDVEGVKNFPLTLYTQSSSDLLKTSVSAVLDKNRFEVVDLGNNYPKNKILTGDIVSFYYKENPIPNHIGYVAKGHNDKLQFYHSIGRAASCSRNESLLGGPVSWTMKKINESALAGANGSMKYGVKRIRYIAELDPVSTTLDVTPGASNIIQLKVFSSDSLPVKDNMEVQFSSPDGTVTSSALTKDGIVQANWQLANRSGSQSCMASIKSPLDNSTILDQVSLIIDAKGLPQLNSVNISLLAKTVVSVEDTIIENGGSAVVETGICYGEHPNVSISDNILQSGMLANTIALDLPGLTKNTNYYLRAYAKNGSGIGYSGEVSFTTLSDADDPYNLSGIWTGWSLEDGSDAGIWQRMNVVIKAGQFSGQVTSSQVPGSGSLYFNGVVSPDGTQLVLTAFSKVRFEGPWTIAGNKLTGVLIIDSPPSPLRRYTYNFIKQ